VAGRRGRSLDGRRLELRDFRSLRLAQAMMHAPAPMAIKKMARSDFDWRRHLDVFVAAVLIGVLSIELYVFARSQDIWLDESTQLSGIGLRFWDMLHWLAGADPNRLGVPADRSPPMSYILDWFWLHLYGNSEIGFRLFHSIFVIAGASCLAIVARRELGWPAMVVSLGFLVLSPKLIQAGVEIRSYPVFFALTCAQVAVFLKVVASPKEPDLKYLGLFGAICLVAIYTHFYGIVSTCAFFLALGISFLRRPVALAQIISAFVIVAIGSAALMPFISAAAGIPLLLPASADGPVVTHEPTTQYISYLLKLTADSANMISLPGSMAFLGGTFALLAASMLAATARLINRNPKPSDWLVAVVISGVLATVTASLFVKTFDVLKTSYSLWLLVPISLLTGAGATSATGFRLWDFLGRRVAVVALFAGAGMSTYMFFGHTSWFVHGPQRFIAALYDNAAAPKAILYDNGAAWAWSYIPLQYSHEGEVVQYRSPDNESGLVRAGPQGTKAVVQDMDATVAPYRVLLVADVRLRTYRDLRGCQYDAAACPEFPSSAIAGALVATGKWRIVDTRRNFGLWDSKVTTLERSENWSRTSRKE
jgi:hypothetical protein